jgi:SAM-dependent methyltransferase
MRSEEPVLDLACGGGRHGRLFLARGHPVTFVDIDVSELSDLEGVPGVEILALDLEETADFPLAGRSFAGVVVTNYLWRPIMADILRLTAPGGLLLYETFAAGNERLGRPRNPDFLLRPDELKRAVADDFAVIAYEHGIRSKSSPAVVQRIAARRL